MRGVQAKRLRKLAYGPQGLYRTRTYTRKVFRIQYMTGADPLHGYFWGWPFAIYTRAADKARQAYQNLKKSI